MAEAELDGFGIAVHSKDGNEQQHEQGGGREGNGLGDPEHDGKSEDGDGGLAPAGELHDLATSFERWRSGKRVERQHYANRSRHEPDVAVGSGAWIWRLSVHHICWNSILAPMATVAN